MQRVGDDSKTKQELLSELIAYRQWCANLESEANSARVAQARAQEMTNLFQKLLRAFSNAVAVLSNETLHEANEAFAKVLNRSLSQILGQKLTDLFTSPSLANLKEGDSEIALETVDGVSFHCQASAITYQQRPAWLLLG